MAHTVKAVADLAGISIRTLHHYDEIGLLKPAQLTAAGYRLYTDKDLEQLQQVLFFRELGLSLQEIKGILNRPDFDRRQALQDHRRLLKSRQERLSSLIQLVDRTLDAMERGIQMSDKDLFAGFDQAKYEEEARQRWGHTKEYEESARRTKQYSPADWAAIQQEGGEIYQTLATLIDSAPTDPQVQEWIQKHHRHINDRFYTCSLEVYRGLGDGYVADPRFAAFFDKIRPGLAQFMQAAMTAYCDRLEGK